MSALPTGIVTFLMTDVESSTRLITRHEGALLDALEHHDRLADEIAARHGGVRVKARGEGDSLFLVFAEATKAVAAACELQQAYETERWHRFFPDGSFPPEEKIIRVRMALHTGPAELRDGDYQGRTVVYCARLRTIAHGGQILFSSQVFERLPETLPDGITALDMGRPPLRDFGPQQVYQLLHSKLEPKFPPLKSANAPNNLPLQLTELIGREDNLKEIRDKMASARMVTLLGAGGCGKTRLALQVGEISLADYADGVWLVELSALRKSDLLSDTDLVLKAIAKVWNVREEAGRDLIQTLIDYLKPRSLLLILDNAEHLASACADICADMLTSCPGLKILATSQKALSVVGSRKYFAHPLDMPPDTAPMTADALQKYPSVQLFVERAQAADAYFILTDKNAPAVAQICRQLEGIPLALEFAAARVPMLKVESIARELQSRLDLLGARDKRYRYRTLRAAMDWSYNLLEPQDQTLLRRLSVFDGGWTLEASEAICSGGEIEAGEMLDILTELNETSFIISEDHGDAKRYRLYGTVRKYSQEKLEASGELEAIRNRHQNYFLELAQEEEPHLIGAKQAASLARLEREHNNLRAALQWPTPGDTRLQLATSLWRFWMKRGYIREGHSWLQNALARRADVSNSLTVKALNATGVFAMRQMKLSDAQEALEKSWAICQQTGNRKGEAEALWHMGNVERARQQDTVALACYEKSLEICRQEKYDWGIAACLSNLGMAKHYLGDNEEARRYYQESLHLFRELGDIGQVALVSNNLGLIYEEQKDYATARPLIEESRAKFAHLRDHWNLAIATHSLGLILRQLQGQEAARPLFLESLQMRYEVGDYASLAFPLYSLGSIAVCEERYEEAAVLFGAAAARSAASGGDISSEEAYKRDLDKAREQLGDQDYNNAWDKGYKMPLDQIVAYTLDKNRLDSSELLMIT